MLNWAKYNKSVDQNGTIGQQLDTIGTQLIQVNRQVKSLMEGIIFCAQQGIALGGHREGENDSNPGNFRSLVNLLSRHSMLLLNSLLNITQVLLGFVISIQNELIHFCE